jgi:hypothetical protein
MCIVVRQTDALFLRLAFHHGCTQHQIGHHDRRVSVVEGQDIGGVVLVAKARIELTAFLGVDDAHRQFGRTLQRGHEAAPHKGPREQRTVAGIGLLQGELEHGSGVWMRGRVQRPPRPAAPLTAEWPRASS